MQGRDASFLLFARGDWIVSSKAGCREPEVVQSRGEQEPSPPREMGGGLSNNPSTDAQGSQSQAGQYNMCLTE